MSYQTVLSTPSAAIRDIEALWDDVFGAFSISRYQWIYEQNPGGLARICLLYAEGTRSVLGSAAVFPRRLSTYGHEMSAGIAADFMISPSHRHAGPALQLQKALIASCMSRGLEVLYGFPNKDSELLLRRIGYKAIRGFVSFSLPLRANRFIEKHTRHTLLQRLGSTVANVLLRFRPSFLVYGLYRRHQSIVTDAEFDQRFEELWLRCKSQFALVGSKTRPFLDWRYTKDPKTNYRVFCAGRKTLDTLDGYIVFERKGQTVFIVDFLCDYSRISTMELLVHFIRHLLRSEVHYITVDIAASDDVLRCLERVGFRNHGPRKPLLLLPLTPSAVTIETIEDGSWYLLCGDND